MVEGSHLIRHVYLPAIIGSALAVSIAASPTYAQNPPWPDTLEVLPDSVREAFVDSASSRAPSFPARVAPLRGPSHEVFSCDRECVQNSSSLSLVELLQEFVPGFGAVRAGFFVGPHHGFDGLFGPGFVVLYIDGREVSSLERAQADLRRLSLNYVAGVRVYRGADGFVIDVDLIRHDGTRAYSRIGGGTGNPAVDILEGVFANGLGRTFNFEGGFELIDVEAGNVENDRFGFLGRLSWMPRSNDFGVQFEFVNSSVDRTGADTADVRRRELVLRTRGNIGDRAQVEAYASSTTHRLVVPGLPDSLAPRARAADAVGFRFSALPERGGVNASARFMGRDAYPSLSANLSGWYPLGPLTFEGGVEVMRWNEFSTGSLRTGIAFQDTTVLPITLRGFTTSGDRGIGFPELASSDSVGFDAFGASANFGLGPFELSGRYSGQHLDRQVGFGGSFDQLVVLDSTQVDVTSVEARLEGPILPLGAVLSGLEPVRIRAFWRQNTSKGAPALFLPESLGRVEVSLHDSFFEDNLELWLTGYLEQRGQRLLPTSGSPEPLLVGSDAWMGGHLMFRIGDFRFFWRFANLGGMTVSDIPGANFPVQLNIFGIRWEFFN